MNEEPRRWLRMPGRIYEHFVAEAQVQTELSAELDLCEAIADAKLKRRGGGFTVYLALTLEQVERLSYWIRDSDRKPLRDYKAEMRASIEKTRAAGS